MRFTVLSLLALVALVAAWTKEDHEIFRLRDEIQQFEGADVTFYDFLSINPSASQEEIGKAYRKKSKLLHPDKAKQSFIASRATAASKTARSSSKSASASAKSASKKPPKPKPTTHSTKPPSKKEIDAAIKLASERFTRLGLINKILTGEGRARYDHFLSNGFPAWKGADYYYSRFRPGLGSVLMGLFLFAGGGVHYGVLVLGHKRRKDFVERYIRQARTLAWGNDSSAAGIPGIDTAGSAAAASVGAEEEREEKPQILNRRERRAQEKESKKPSAAKRMAAQASRSGTSTPRPEDGSAGIESPVPGPKKRVQAENGKVLVVDSAGNVFLEEADEDGNNGLFLLDPNEVELPTFSQTIVVTLPLWFWSKITQTVLGGPKGAASTGGKQSPESEKNDELDGYVNVQDEDAYEKQLPPALKKRKGKKQ